MTLLQLPIRTKNRQLADMGIDDGFENTVALINSKSIISVYPSTDDVTSEPVCIMDLSNGEGFSIYMTYDDLAELLEENGIIIVKEI